MSEPQTIVPGFLVNLRTVLKGGVHYETSEEARLVDGSTEQKTWRTVRTVDDIEEQKAAVEARNRAGNLIRAACVPTPFGLLCREDRIDNLRAKIAEARKIADEHNKDAKYAQIGIYVLMGRIASNDKEAARAILSDIREARDEMMKGIKEADVQSIRKAAEKARQLSKMLSPKQGEVVSATIEAAREAAKQIVRRVEKKSESLAKVIVELDLKPISDLRFVNIDSDDPEQSPRVSLPKASIARFAAVEAE